MTTVREIMKKSVATVSPSASIAEVARKIRDFRVEFIMVCENGKFRGIVSTESVISWLVTGGHNPKRHSADSLARKDVPKVPPGADIIEAAKIMANHDATYMPVVQNGKLAGVLTLDDLLRESPALAVIVMTKQSESKTRKEYAFAR